MNHIVFRGEEDKNKKDILVIDLPKELGFVVEIPLTKELEESIFGRDELQ